MHWFDGSLAPASVQAPAAAAAAKPVSLAEAVAGDTVSADGWEKIGAALPELLRLGVALPKVVVHKVAPPPPPVPKDPDDIFKQLQDARARRMQADKAQTAKAEALRLAQEALEEATKEHTAAEALAKEASAAEKALETAFAEAHGKEKEKENEKNEEAKDAMSDIDTPPDVELAPEGSAERRTWEAAQAAAREWNEVKRRRRKTILEAQGEATVAANGALQSG